MLTLQANMTQLQHRERLAQQRRPHLDRRRCRFRIHAKLRIASLKCRGLTSLALWVKNTRSTVKPSTSSGVSQPCRNLTHTDICS